MAGRGRRALGLGRARRWPVIAATGEEQRGRDDEEWGVAARV
jgi:hypothetical protein